MSISRRLHNGQRAEALDHLRQALFEIKQLSRKDPAYRPSLKGVGALIRQLVSVEVV